MPRKITPSRVNAAFFNTCRFLDGSWSRGAGRGPRGRRGVRTDVKDDERTGIRDPIHSGQTTEVATTTVYTRPRARYAAAQIYKSGYCIPDAAYSTPTLPYGKQDETQPVFIRLHTLLFILFDTSCTPIPCAPWSRPIDYLQCSRCHIGHHHQAPISAVSAVCRLPVDADGSTADADGSTADADGPAASCARATGMPRGALDAWAAPDATETWKPAFAPPLPARVTAPGAPGGGPLTWARASWRSCSWRRGDGARKRARRGEASGAPFWEEPDEERCEALAWALETAPAVPEGPRGVAPMPREVCLISSSSCRSVSLRSLSLRAERRASGNAGAFGARSVRGSAVVSAGVVGGFSRAARRSVRWDSRAARSASRFRVAASTSRGAGRLSSCSLGGAGIPSLSSQNCLGARGVEGEGGGRGRRERARGERGLVSTRMDTGRRGKTGGTRGGARRAGESGGTRAARTDPVHVQALGAC